MRPILSTTLVCVCTFTFSVSVWAQPVAGSGVVGGVIRDSYGEGLPDAEVILENEAAGVRRVMQTSLDGVFEAVGLPPAPGYRLRVSHKNYHSWSSEEFETPAGQRVSFDVTLEARDGRAPDGAQAAPVTVNPSPDPVSAVIRAQQLETLPVEKRQWENLLLLAPATTWSRGLTATVIGGQAASNAYFTDGLLTNNTYPTRRSAPAGRLPQDAVQGVQVLVSGSPVEFGHALGGAVNTVTRSGGKQLRGSVYEYFSNRSLAAIPRYAFGNQLFRKRTQTGMELGGAVPKTNLFFFANGEVLDSHGATMNRITNPLIAGDGGRAVDLSNCKATAAQCALAARFVESQMNAMVGRSEHSVSGAGKIDYRRSDRHTVTVAAHANHTRRPLGARLGEVSSDGGLLGSGTTKGDSHYGKIEWLSTPSPSSANEMRWAWFHDRISNSGTKTPGLSTGAVAISVAGVNVGEAQADAGVWRQRRTQFIDHLRFSAGAHTFLLGVDWTRTRDWVGSLAGASGAYFYPSLTAFAQDLSGAGRKNYTLFTQTFGNPVRELRSSEISVYAQDTWKVTRKLQVIGGLRYTKPVLPQPSMENRKYYATRQVNSPNINADPRIGASYLLGSRTVVRASFGMFHAPHSGELMDALFLGNGVYQSRVEVSPAQSGSPLFPAVLPASAIPTGTVNVMYADAKLRSPYTKQTTVAIERDLGRGTLVTASYVGVRGVKLWTAVDMNLAEPNRSATYTITDASGQRTGTFTTAVWTSRVDPSHAHVFEVSNGGSSWYRALTLQLRQRIGKNFSARAAYTWSHAIDDQGGNFVSGSIPWNSYNADHRMDRGSSAFDQRHRAAFDWLWQPKPLKNDSPAARYLVNGWEISSIITLASALPATPRVVVNGQQFANLPMAFPGSLNGSGGWARVPFLPVSHLRADPEYTVNLRLGRPITIRERLTAKLIFEAFNAFNTKYNTGVNTIAYTAANGVLTPVPRLGAGNAAGDARSCQAAIRISF
jgi:hypothetical protein